MDVSVPVGEFEIEKGVPIPLPYSCVLEDQQEGFSPPMFYKVVDSGVRMEFGSADSDIALVDGAGKVVGVAPGETSITVKAVNAVSEKSTSLKVRCFEYQNDLDAVPERLDVKAGEAMDLAKLYEEYIRWNALIETSDENIATVDGTVLTAGKPGDATVSLTLGGETRNIAFRSIKMATEYTLNHDTLEGEAGTTARLATSSRRPPTADSTSLSHPATRMSLRPMRMARFTSSPQGRPPLPLSMSLAWRLSARLRLFLHPRKTLSSFPRETEIGSW